MRNSRYHSLDDSFLALLDQTIATDLRFSSLTTYAHWHPSPQSFRSLLMLGNCTSAPPEEESTLMSSREREGSMPRREAVVEPGVAPGGEIYGKGEMIRWSEWEILQ